MANSIALPVHTAAISILCVIGSLLSIYSYYVEAKVVVDNSYEAMCDISERISCTKVFTSEYGRGFGIIAPIFGHQSVLNQPNGVFGIVFYTIVAFLGLTNNITAARLQTVLASLSNIISLYLGYILYFVLEDFCVVCVSMYAINLSNCFLTLRRYDLVCAAAIAEEQKSVTTKKDD